MPPYKTHYQKHFSVLNNDLIVLFIYDFNGWNLWNCAVRGHWEFVWPHCLLFCYWVSHLTVLFTRIKYQSLFIQWFFESIASLYSKPISEHLYIFYITIELVSRHLFCQRVSIVKCCHFSNDLPNLIHRVIKSSFIKEYQTIHVVLTIKSKITNCLTETGLDFRIFKFH